MKKFLMSGGLILAVLIGTIYVIAETEKKEEGVQSTDHGDVSPSQVYRDPWADPFFEEDPFLELERFHRRMQRWMHSHYGPMRHGPGGFPEGFYFSEPRMDVEDGKEEIVIRCDLPGMEKDKIELSISDNVLIIKGTRDVVQQENKDSGNVRVYHSERSMGSFYRTIPMPSEVDSGKARAEYENGVLTIHLPKKEPEEKKTVPIQITRSGASSGYSDQG